MVEEEGEEGLEITADYSDWSTNTDKTFSSKISFLNVFFLL